MVDFLDLAAGLAEAAGLTAPAEEPAPSPAAAAPAARDASAVQQAAAVSPAAPKVLSFPEDDICKFGRFCARPDCWYQHPAGRQMDRCPEKALCKFGPNCTKPGCFFNHAAPAPKPIIPLPAGSNIVIKLPGLQTTAPAAAPAPARSNDDRILPRKMHLDELSMPSRPDVKPSPELREVFVDPLPGADGSDELKEFLEAFEEVESVDRLPEQERGYMRFKSLEAASNCVASGAGSWSESERALLSDVPNIRKGQYLLHCTGTQLPGVYPASLVVLLAGAGGSNIKQLMKSTGVKYLKLVAGGRSLGRPEQQSSRVHFSCTGTASQFETLKEALQASLAKAHEQMSKFLKLLKPCTVTIENVPSDYSADQLQQVLSSHGTAEGAVEECDAGGDSSSSSVRIVRFPSHESACEAVRCVHGKTLAEDQPALGCQLQPVSTEQRAKLLEASPELMGIVMRMQGDQSNQLSEWVSRPPEEPSSKQEKVKDPPPEKPASKQARIKDRSPKQTKIKARLPEEPATKQAKLQDTRPGGGARAGPSEAGNEENSPPDFSGREDLEKFVTTLKVNSAVAKYMLGLPEQVCKTIMEKFKPPSDDADVNTKLRAFAKLYAPRGKNKDAIARHDQQPNQENRNGSAVCASKNSARSQLDPGKETEFREFLRKWEVSDSTMGNLLNLQAEEVDSMISRFTPSDGCIDVDAELRRFAEELVRHRPSKDETCTALALPGAASSSQQDEISSQPWRPPQQSSPSEELVPSRPPGSWPSYPPPHYPPTHYPPPHYPAQPYFHSAPPPGYGPPPPGWQTPPAPWGGPYAATHGVPAQSPTSSAGPAPAPSGPKKSRSRSHGHKRRRRKREEGGGSRRGRRS